MIMSEQLTLLILDDQEGLRRLLAEYFTQEGFRVETAADCQEALQAFERVTPDVLLLDYKLPGITGLEVLHKLKDSGCRAPAILMTAYNDIEPVNRSGEPGVKEIVGKPFDLEELKKAVLRVQALG